MLNWFLKPQWLFSEDGETVAIADVYERDDEKIRFVATPSGRALLDVIFPHWDRIFMD